MNFKKVSGIIGLITVFFILFTGCVDPYRQAQYMDSSIKSNSVKDILSKDDNFKFLTSRTESSKSLKAYIFSTDMSVQEAAQYINAKKKAHEASDLNSSEKIILTYDDEYAAIYQANNNDGKNETMVQASNRQYFYRTRNRGFYNPYRPALFIPYPVYYERNMLNRDRSRYGSIGTTKSVRTGSSGSGFNRGGGTGFGK